MVSVFLNGKQETGKRQTSILQKYQVQSAVSLYLHSVQSKLNAIRQLTCFLGMGFGNLAKWVLGGELQCLAKEVGIFCEVEGCERERSSHGVGIVKNSMEGEGEGEGEAREKGLS